MFKTTAYFGLSTIKGTRICSETALNWLIASLRRYNINSFTVKYSIGVWNGRQENVLVISITDEKERMSELKGLGSIYCHDFDQDSVLVECQRLESFSFVEDFTPKNNYTGGNGVSSLLDNTTKKESDAFTDYVNRPVY